MEVNGIELGEMNMLLLKKIEELTLHTISQEKALKDKDQRLEKLETQNQTMLSRLEAIERCLTDQ